jgi:type VII secretion integral membrane protein EccD
VYETGAELCRVSVYSDSAHVDLALPATVPVGTLIPPIVDILATQHGYRDESIAVLHQLSLPGDAALDSSKTLAQIGIRNGATLILTRTSTELAAPRFGSTTQFDDTAEAVSMSLAATARPWTRWTARLTGAIAASWLAGTSAVALFRTAFGANGVTNGIQHIDCASVAAAIGFIALLAATVGYRVLRDRIVGLTLGMVANGFAALAGLLAVPDGPGAPNVLLAAMATAVTSTVSIQVIGCCTVVFTALACFATMAAAAATVDAVTTAPLQAIGAMAAVISLGLLEVSARVSIVLTGLSPRLPSESNAVIDTPMSNPHHLNTKAIRASHWLTSLLIAFSTSAGLGAIGAAVGSCSAGGSPLLGITFAAIIGGVLLLRARSHSDLVRSAPLIVSGTATFSTTFVVAAATYPLHALWIAAAAAMLAIAALSVGLITPGMVISPVGQRSIELLEYLALVIVVPLACWICGLFGAARGVNLP